MEILKFARNAENLNDTLTENVLLVPENVRKGLGNLNAAKNADVCGKINLRYFT